MSFGPLDETRRASTGPVGDDAFSAVLQRAQHVRSERGSEVSTASGACCTTPHRAQHVRSERGSEASIAGGAWCTTPFFPSGSLLPLSRGSLEQSGLLPPMSARIATPKDEEMTFLDAEHKEDADSVDSSTSTQYEKILDVLEAEARNRRQEIIDLRDLNSKLQNELEQERQTNVLLRQDRPSEDKVSKQLLVVLETEARNRRSEISDLRDLNAELQAELEQERETVVLLKRSGCSQDGSGGVSREMLATVRAKETDARRDLEQELLKLREENVQLKAGIQSQDLFKEELRKLAAENERIRALMATAMSTAEEEARKRVEEELSGLRSQNAALQNSTDAKAAETELATIKREVTKFLAAAHESLSDARTVCVQAEASLKKSSARVQRPPPVYDLQSLEASSLKMIPDVLSYITGVLLEIAATENKSSWAGWNIRYLHC